ncbi:hypothetical protein [Flavobacterium sp. GT3R68]|uniref:hypothetical protein n=1 Tax=Flavobacterium sp. GT3R68 TaxID=2594437 RepID=UPI0021028713|nr:hypothetical protein [Flavobacterium sp. GT3R68]
MNKTTTILIYVFLLSQIAIGQRLNEKWIHGKILADSSSVEKIDVVNLANEKVTMTNKAGEFFILAQLDDVLVFSGIHLEFKRMLVDEDDMKSDIVIVKMVPKINELNEVIVRRDASEGRSIIPGIKTYTPAERKLYTAQSGLLDAPINWISGRTAMLKKEVVVERKERLIAKVEYLYQDTYYTETLKIPLNYIRDFQYYIIEDAPFVAALKAKNKTMMLFLISKLAVNYNHLIGDVK